MMCTTLLTDDLFLKRIRHSLDIIVIGNTMQSKYTYDYIFLGRGAPINFSNHCNDFIVNLSRELGRHQFLVYIVSEERLGKTRESEVPIVLSKN